MSTLDRPHVRASTLPLCVITSLFVIGQAAYGQQPPDVVTSDSDGNTAMGTAALQNNTTSSNNTAAGIAALQGNTTGVSNTAAGAYALGDNTIGFSNTASGAGALRFNTSGSENTAAGEAALWNNTSGNDNIASGLEALFSNTVGNANIAIGTQALHNSATGNGNIAIGDNAGYNLTTGNNDIYIGNFGLVAESGAVRIGNAGQHTKTFIAGVWGKQVSRGASVVVNSSGQLGVEESSERYKTDIAPMGSGSANIKLLRPVTFHLKTDPTGELQYGLIAEEVDTVYPELVVRDDEGKIEGVRYDRLAPILLNEVQQQQQKLAAQEERLTVQTQNFADLKRQFAELLEVNRTMQAALANLQARESSVAMR